jgi:hypothetical protein
VCVCVCELSDVIMQDYCRSHACVFVCFPVEALDEGSVRVCVCALARACGYACVFVSERERVCVCACV